MSISWSLEFSINSFYAACQRFSSNFYVFSTSYANPYFWKYNWENRILCQIVKYYIVDILCNFSCYVHYALEKSRKMSSNESQSQSTNPWLTFLFLDSPSSRIDSRLLFEYRTTRRTLNCSSISNHIDSLVGMKSVPLFEAWSSE